MKFAFALAAALTLPAGQALADHNAPAKAPSKTISMVRAYDQCTTDAGLGPRARPPLPAIACAATTSSPLHFDAKGAGTLKLTVVKKPDVNAVGKLSKVLDASGPYTGGLSMVADARITDTGCGGEHCTVVDLPQIPIGFSGACKKGACKFKTSFNSLADGIIVSGEQINMQFSRVRVFDGDNQPAFQDGVAAGPNIKTKPLTTSLASYMQQCTNIDPTLFHHSPLALSACQPLPGSTLHFLAKGTGSLKLTVDGNGDVAVKGSLKEIGNPTPYTGDLGVSADVRLTDNGCTGSVACTIADAPLTLAAPAACKLGKCKIKTTINTQYPDLIRPADQLNMQITNLRVTDGTGRPAFEEGVAIP